MKGDLPYEEILASFELTKPIPRRVSPEKPPPDPRVFKSQMGKVSAETAYAFEEFRYALMRLQIKNEQPVMLAPPTA